MTKPLEVDRERLTTSKNVGKHYQIREKTFLDLGFAFKNPSDSADEPFSESIKFHPWALGRIVSFDESHGTKTTIAKELHRQCTELRHLTMCSSIHSITLLARLVVCLWGLPKDNHMRTHEPPLSTIPPQIAQSEQKTAYHGQGFLFGTCFKAHETHRWRQVTPPPRGYFLHPPYNMAKIAQHKRTPQPPPPPKKIAQSEQKTA